MTEHATNAAPNMGDSVFSMFGGGAKKEKKGEDDEDRGDVSGSAKAQKAATAENPEVRFQIQVNWNKF